MNAMLQRKLDAACADLDAIATANRPLTTADLAQAQDIEHRIRMLESGGSWEDGWRPMFHQERGNLHRGYGATSEERELNRLVSAYVRTGARTAEDELRAYNNTDMNVTTPADGEVAVPVGMVRSIVAKRDETALFPKLGCIRVPGKGTTVNYPIDNESDVVFTAVAESAAISQDAPALAEKAFTLVKYAKYLTLTWELIRDEDANLLPFINNWVARGWAATHNTALITEVLANGTAALTLDSATAIGATEIPELVGKLPPEYQQGAQWIMHPTTFSHVSGIASSSQFTFAPHPGGDMASSTPFLWGFPVHQSSWMTSLAASVKSLVLLNGEFVGVREGTGLTMLRDPYSAAINGHVRLWFWFDLAVGVLQAEGVVYASHPSA